MSATWISKKRNQQPDKREWSESMGWQTVRTWIVPADDRAALEQELITDGAIKVSSTDDGATSTVSGTYPDARDGAQPSETAANVVWELLGSDLNKDIRTHKDLRAADGSAGDSARKDINAAFEAVSAGSALVSTWDTKAATIFRLLSKGTTEYAVTIYVLRQTIKCAAADGVRASMDDCNRVVALPAYPTSLFNLSGLKMPDDSGTSVEWLKKPPTVTYLGGGKYAITQEYWGASWSQVLYGGTALP
jgi:hypothetical protein